MSELHWTGAALLLAIAVLDGKPSRPRRRASLSSASDARQPDLHGAEHATPDAPAGGTPTMHTPAANRQPRRQLIARAAPTAAPSATPRQSTARVAATPRAGRPERSPERVLYRAETTCLHRGRTAGEMVWSAGSPGEYLLPLTDTSEPPRPVPRGGRPRRRRRGGPLFAERAERVAARPGLCIEPPGRGRRRKPTTLRIS